jgi:transposase
MSRKLYSDEFKSDAAKLVLVQGYTIKRAAHSLGVDPASIRAWIKKFGPSIGAGLVTSNASPDQLQRDNARLREENRRLLMEREILKKAAAFFAKELT